MTNKVLILFAVLSVLLAVASVYWMPSDNREVMVMSLAIFGVMLGINGNGRKDR